VNCTSYDIDSGDYDPPQNNSDKKNTISQQQSISPWLQQIIEDCHILHPSTMHFLSRKRIPRSVAFVHVQIALHHGGKHSKFI
jgi:hypothetical protein